MTVYLYEAINTSGKSTKGKIDAESSDDALQKIRDMGLYPSAVRQDDGTDGVKKKKGFFGFGGSKNKSDSTSGDKKGVSINIPNPIPIGLKQLTLFTRQLSTLQDAGLPILRSLQILQQQNKGRLGTTLAQICTDVEGGASLSEAMARHPKVFDRLYSKMVAAGEVGGVLDVILQRLAMFKEKSQQLRTRIKGAMIYPVIVIIIAMAIVTAIMYFVIPKFQDIFSDFGVDLPDLTVLLINTSAWVAGKDPNQAVPGWVMVLGSMVIIPIVIIIARKIKVVRDLSDFFILKMPVFGGLIKKATIARFTRTLGTLISAGVPILEAVLITRDTSGNAVYEKALGKVHDSIREGDSVAEPLRQAKVCDSIVTNMIEVGEETGDLDVMLSKIADNYDEEVDVAVAGMTKLIEPLLVVVLGGIVLGIVLALFLPLVKMIENISA